LRDVFLVWFGLFLGHPSVMHRRSYSKLVSSFAKILPNGGHLDLTSFIALAQIKYPGIASCCSWKFQLYAEDRLHDIAQRHSNIALPSRIQKFCNGRK
jgi:hypothetical protein